MNVTNWVAIGIAAVTLMNGWVQLWFKERILSQRSDKDAALTFFRSRFGLALVCLTGVVSVISIWMLVLEVSSSEPITRLSAFYIAGFVALSILNLFLIHSLYVLRRLAAMRRQIEESRSLINASLLGLFH